MHSEGLRFEAFFSELVAQDDLAPSTVRAAFEAILAGAWTPVQVGAFATALRLRGESPAIVAEGVRALRHVMKTVEHDLPVTLDTCGTGGDGLGTLNLSSAAAIVVASMGVHVAKHGNRAASSRAGSADVFEALGIPIDLAPEHQARVLREAGIAFLYAPAHHPALRHAAAARKELGIRTIFNVLGPLANPARVSHQLVGTCDERHRRLLAETLRDLGTRRAWVVHGKNGLDEISPAGETFVTELRDGAISECSVVPEDFGLERCDLRAIRGGDAAENARTVLAILRGEPHPARNAIVLNAAAAYVVATDAPLREAANLAERALESGAAFETLERWRAIARAAKEESVGPAR